MNRIVSDAYDKTAKYCNSFQLFCSETAQWRRPSATSVYLLATNALFWACVFYGEQFYQFSFLCGLSVLLFANHVLFPVSQLSINFVKRTSDFPVRFESFCQLPIKEKFVECIKFLLALPFYAIILPFFNIVRWIFMQKFVEYTIMITSATAAGLLKVDEIEKACWVSYLTALFLLVVPPWRYNRVTEQLTEYLESICASTYRNLNEKLFVPFSSAVLKVLDCGKYYFLGFWVPPLLRKIKEQLIDLKNFIRRTIVEPIWIICCDIKCAFVYVFFGYWVPPLVEYLRFKFSQFCRFINETFIDPVRRFLCRLKEIFVYVFFGHWIPPLVDYANEKWTRLKTYVDTNVIQPTCNKIIAVKNFLVYWFGGYWIPSFKQWCYDCKTRAVNLFHERIIDPIVDFFLNFTENMTYIILGRWIPGFLRYVHENWLVPTFALCIKAKNAFVYVAFGYWIPELIEYLQRKKSEFVDYVRRSYVEPLKIFIYEAAERLKNYLVETRIRIRNYVVAKAIQAKNWIVETKRRIKIYLIVTLRRLKICFTYDVYIPLKKASRRSWIRFKFFVKYKIIFPIIRNTILSVIYSVQWTYENVATPTFAFLYEQSVHFCGYMWYYYGDPCWQWVSIRLPEKSPFVDDSDTELKDYLPPTNQDEEESSSSDDENLIERRDSGAITRTPSSSSLEEAEFSQNLEIPSLEHADSDEEQEREMAPRLNSQTHLSPTTARKPTKLKSIATKDKNIIISTKNVLPKVKSTSTAAIVKKSPTSPIRDFTDALTNAATFAMFKTSVGASFISSQLSNIMSSSSPNEEQSLFEADLEPDFDRSSKDRSAFEADLEPDFELVQHSDVDDEE